MSGGALGAAALLSSEPPLGVTVDNPAFPTTLAHVRASVEQVAEQLPEYRGHLEGWRAVRVVTPVKVRGRVAHRGGDVTYGEWPPPPRGASHVMTWSARTGSPVPVPARQVAWL